MSPAGAGPPAPSPLTYAAAGVDIDAGEAAVDAIRDLVASTADRPGVIGSIGGFGGLFALPPGYDEPVLVASTDGVGTKMAVASEVGRLDSIGVDLVAMCVDDVVCCGAEPLLFLDYQLLGAVDPAQVREVMTGIAQGCRQAGCAILGGELAEHPGLLRPGELDVSGFAVGVVERSSILDGPANAAAGDVLVALPSPGLRSNGYSLARAALLSRAGRRLDGPAWDGASHSLADELLRPSLVYSPAVLAAIAAGGVRAAAHITGGGIPGNLARVLPPDLDAAVERSSWVEPRIFAEVRSAGEVQETEMLRVFNLGVGMVLVVEPAAVAAVASAVAGFGHDPVVIGRLVPGSGKVNVSDRKV